jgi:hypothetical protein
VSIGTMARPKKIRPEAKLPPKTIALRTSGEYAAWVEALAKHNRTTIAGLVDQALVKHAREIGFDTPAPER